MRWSTQVVYSIFCSAMLLATLAVAQRPTPAPATRAQRGDDRPKKELSPEEFQKVVANSLLQAKAKAGLVIKNPYAEQFDAPAFAALQSQRQGAEVEATQMKIGIRSVGLPAIQSQPMSVMGAKPTSRTQTPTAAKTQNLQMASNTPPAQVSGPSTTSKIPAQASNIDTTIVTCGHDPTMRITSVSGEHRPATFTPIDKYNFYTIRGCSFGDLGANSRVYVYDKSGFQGNFQIKFWNENGINIVLDPALSGSLDRDNLFLVVQRADGRQVEASGYKFYAARQTVPLHSIPAGTIELEEARYGFNSPVPATSKSPVSQAGGIVPSDAVGKTLLVYRLDSHKFTGQHGDIINLKGRMARGWLLASVQPFYYEEINCPGIVTYKGTLGSWNWQWAQDGVIHGQFAATTCSGYIPPAPPFCFSPFGCGYNDHTGSVYALTLWVSGPRCTDPYTGQPDQGCIQRVRQGQD
jgi:hypothetical protein